mmetsp:Transcript_18559/g.37812  ORF Transcript_18559/g.37812 Transcript_18559/m.37812 type:complete len:276 (-) Transcript_18559:177-1004(-)
MTRSASATMLHTREAQLGMSPISPTLCPALHTPPSGSPRASASRPRLPSTSCRTSSNCSPAPFSRSMRSTSSVTALRKARAVLCSLRNMRTVAVSSASTTRSLKACGQLASALTAKRVPQLTPAAPSASAAASWRPVATPPLQMYGALSVIAPLACSTKLPTSSSPGWPAHSKPSSEMMSTPSFSAFSAWRIETHLWMHTIGGEAVLNMRIQRDGLLPAVSTTLTPSSMNIRQYSSYGGGGPIVGSTVRLTPKGLLVSVLSRRISMRAFSGEPAL